KKQIQKTYRALTMRQDYSHIPDDIVNSKVKIDIEPGLHCKWESLVLRGKRRAYVSPIGKPSLTLAIYLGENKNNQLLWDLHPVTGRPHQLRFDLSRHGFPILGDKLYGSNINFSASAIALQSYEIDFKNAPGVSSLDLPEKIQISPLE
ncbi:MAG TPA: hypothetical protein VN132_05510, partial [Bdellovibrio sp.]|nr:hypothetical protein [Bdellovibrio sp.]